MYYGEAQTVFDDKSRITVPVRIRETMEHLGHLQWFMTRGFDGSVFLFPRPEWDKILVHAGKYAAMDGQAIDFRRMFFGSVAEARPDRQGRMPVPQHLRELAGLEKKEAALVGVGEHLELWTRDAWRAFQQKKDPDYKRMATELFMPNGAPPQPLGTAAAPQG